MATEIDSRLERFRVDPSDGRTFVALVRALRQTGNGELLSEVFELRAKRSADDEEAARLWLALADVYWRQEPRRRAVALQQAVERARSSSTLLSAMEQVLDGRGEDDALASVLEHVARTGTSTRSRLHSAERLLGCARTDDDRVVAWSTIGELEPARAAEAASALRGLARTARSEELYGRAEALASAAGDEELLLDIVVERLTTAPPDRPGQYALDALRCARLWMEVRGDAGTALQWIHAAYERSPSDAPQVADTLARLGEHLVEPDGGWAALQREVAGALGRWDDALAAAKVCADLASGEDRAAWLFDVAEILHENLGRGAEAIPHYRDAAALDARFVPAAERRLAESAGRGDGSDAVREARIELLERQDDWVSVVALLEESAANESGDRAAALWARAAEFRLGRLLDSGGAFSGWMMALSLAGDPDRRSEIASSLTRLVSDPDAGSSYLNALRPEFERRALHADLVRAIRTRLDVESSPTQIAALAREAAELYEGRLQRPDDAVRMARRAVNATPDDEAAWDHLRALLVEHGRTEDALVSVAEEAEQTSRPARRAHLALANARLLDDANAPAAARLDAWLAARASGHDEASTTALAALVTDDEGRAAAEEAVHRASRSGGSEAAATLAWNFAVLAELESSTGRGFAAQALATGLLDGSQLDALRVVAERAGDRDLRRDVHLEIARTAPADERRDAERTLWKLALDAGETEEATERLLSWLDAEPDDEEAHRALLPLLRETDAAEWSRVAERALTLDGFANAQIAMLRELAIVYGSVLGRPDLAVNALRRLLYYSPEDQAAIATVRAVAEADGNLELLYETLASGVATLADERARTQRHLDLVGLCIDEMEDEERAGEHQWAIAESSAATPEERRSAARWLRERLVANRAATDAADAFRHELLAMDENAAESAADVIDEVLESRAWETAFALATTAARTVRDHQGPLWDRAAIAAGRLQRDEDVREALAAWHAIDASSMPLDRRARLAALSSDEEDGRALLVEVLVADPSQPDALHALATSEPEIRRAVAEDLLAATEGDVVESAHRAAEILASFPEGISRAEEVWRARLAADAADERAFARLDASLRARDAVEERRALLTEELARRDDEEARLPLLRALSLLSENEEERERNLRAIVESDLTDTEARHALAGLYRKQERYPELADILEDLGEIEESDTDRLRAWNTLAKISLYQLEDKARAARAMEKVVALDESDTATLERWVKLLRTLESWDALADALQVQVDRTADPDARIEALRSLAKVCETHIEDPARACVALEAIATLEPANLPVLEDLGRLYAAQERWTDHLHALERLANTTNIRELQAEVFVGAARAMHEHLGRHAEAVGLLENAFRTIHPTEAQLDLLRGAAGAGELWLPLANVLREVSSREDDDERRLALELEIAAVLDEKAGDGPTAVAWLVDVVRARRDAGPALDALEARAAAHGLRSNLAEVYRDLAAANDSNDEVWWRAMSSSARLAVDELKRPDVGFDLLARAADRPALRERAEEAMGTLVREHGLWEKQRDWLEGRVDQGDDDLEARALQKARLEEAEMGDWEAAFETLMGALQDAPESVAVRAELYRLASEHGAWEIVLKLYEVLQDDASESLRIRLLLEMARIQADVLGLASQAFTQTLRAWQLRTRDADLRAALAASAAAAGRTVDLLAAWEWEARQMELVEDQEDALARAAELAVELGQWERALVAWRTLVALPGRTDHWAEASDRAVEMPELRSALLDAWAEALASIRDPSARARLLLRWSEAATSLGRELDAAVLIEAEIPQQKRNLALRDALVDAAAAAGDAERLARALEEYVQVCDDDAKRLELVCHRARVLLHELGRSDDAVALQRRALSMPGADEEVAAAYVEMLRALERWDDLAEFHMDRAGRSEGAERVSSYLAAAAVVEEYLGDARRALRIVDAVLTDHPEHREALEVRARALAGLERWADQIATLDKLSGQLEGRAAGRVLAQAAETSELQLFNAQQATAWWMRAAEADPNWVRPLAEVARLVMDAGDASGAIDAQRAAVATARSSTHATSRERADAFVTLATWLEAAADDASDALAEVQALLEEALEVDPSHPTARQAYERVLEESGGLDRLLILLDEEMERATSDSERARVLCKRAAVYAFEAQREADARRALERATSLAPQRLAPVALLADIHFAHQRWNDAEPLYRRLLSSGPLDAADLLEPRKLIVGETASAGLVPLYRTRHAVCLEKTGRLDEAWDLYSEAQLDDDAYPPALAALARISVLRGNHAGASIHIQHFLDHAESAPAEMVGEMKLLAARIAESQGDTKRAVQLYDEAAALGGPVRRDVIERAAQAAMRSGNWSSVIPRLEQLVDLAETTEERAKALVQLSEALAHEEEVDVESVRRHLFQAVVFCDDRSALLERATEIAEDLLDADACIALFDEMLQAVDAPEKKARIYAALGRVRQNAEGVITTAVAEAYTRALEHAPGESAILERCVASWRALGALESLRDALHRALGALGSGSAGARVSILRQLGVLLWDELGDGTAARDAFETLVTLAPGDVPALEYLLAIYESEGFEDDERAAEIASDLVERGHMSVDLLRSLERLAYGAGNIDGVLQILELLRFAGESEPSEDDLLDSLPATAPRFEAGRLAGDAFERWVRPAAWLPEAGKVFAAAIGVWARNHPKATVLAGDEVGSGAVRDVFDGLCGAFALEASLRMDADQEALTRVIASSPPAVVISPDLFALGDESVLRFELAKALTLTRPEYLGVAVLSAFDMVAFVEAALEPLCTDQRTLDDSLRRALVRWKERLNGYQVPLGVQPRLRDAWPSPGTWRDLAMANALRCGLIASASPRVALERAWKELDLAAAQSMDDVSSACAQSPALQSLLGYIVSPTWLEVRSALGVARVPG